MLRDILKQEIDKLNDNQLKRIAEFIDLVKSQPKHLAQSVPFWQKATPTERAQDFLAWVGQLPKTGVSLPDEACDRGNIYEDLQDLREAKAEEGKNLSISLEELKQMF